MRISLYKIFFGLLFLQGGAFAVVAQEQEPEADAKDLKTSVDLTYEANNELEEDFVAAEATYRKAIAKSEKNAVARYNLGNAYYKENSMGEAFMRYKEAGETAMTKPEKHKAFHNMGNVFMKNEEYQKAVEAYKEALRNDPTDEETRYNLALAKEKLKKEQQQNQQNQDDQNQDNQDNKDNQQNQDQQNQDQQQKDEQQQDQEGGEQDDEQDKGDPNKDGDQKEEQEKEGQGDKEQKQKKPEEGEGEPQQPRKSQLSPQQIKNILEAMNNEEKKVQEKINGKKVKGAQVKTEKDW
ncbi:tetratricopeptide repeat protein [Robertkochia sediminum]|uniref:tetratricopeptide repeat protein n=1 Tax=Robertkochia sediminum TaxID=2785326 RepID=UPI001931BF82|nr:tetratricopeptide repeat protein [Robertkochia sediminum]MBL7471896.1 tetratricopeptide repeat protein [Robertkochia sediminum]